MSEDERAAWEESLQSFREVKGNMCAKVYNNEPLTVDEHKIVNYVPDVLARGRDTMAAARTAFHEGNASSDYFCVYCVI